MSSLHLTLRRSPHWPNSARSQRTREGPMSPQQSPPKQRVEMKIQHTTLTAQYLVRTTLAASQCMCPSSSRVSPYPPYFSSSPLNHVLVLLTNSNAQCCQLAQILCRTSWDIKNNNKSIVTFPSNELRTVHFYDPHLAINHILTFYIFSIISSCT